MIRDAAQRQATPLGERIAAHRILFQWLVGVAVGTTLIAVTSPLFIRSYLPRRIDRMRGVSVLQPGGEYRWRSEGYATTSIGDHGMAGRSIVPEKLSKEIRVAIWGDSQAEGMPVADEAKLHRQIERLSKDSEYRIIALPMARSGDDLTDWLPQFRRVEDELEIDLHVLLVVEIADLFEVNESATGLEVAPTNPTLDSNSHQAWIATSIPAFMIHASRRVLRTPDDSPRTLRFRPGWGSGTPAMDGTIVASTPDWNLVMRTIAESTDRPVHIIYAPKIVPSHKNTADVVFGEPDVEAIESIRSIAHHNQVSLTDIRESLRSSAMKNRWPHGFHNGRIGEGHLNETGYQIIALDLVRAIDAMRVHSMGSTAR